MITVIQTATLSKQYCHYYVDNKDYIGQCFALRRGVHATSETTSDGESMLVFSAHCEHFEEDLKHDEIAGPLRCVSCLQAGNEMQVIIAHNRKELKESNEK